MSDTPTAQYHYFNTKYTSIYENDVRCVHRRRLVVAQFVDLCTLWPSNWRNIIIKHVLIIIIIAYAIITATMIHTGHEESHGIKTVIAKNIIFCLSPSLDHFCMRDVNKNGKWNKVNKMLFHRLQMQPSGIVGLECNHTVHSLGRYHSMVAMCLPHETTATIGQRTDSSVLYSMPKSNYSLFSAYHI